MSGAKSESVRRGGKGRAMRVFPYCWMMENESDQKTFLRGSPRRWFNQFLRSKNLNSGCEKGLGSYRLWGGSGFAKKKRDCLRRGRGGLLPCRRDWDIPPYLVGGRAKGGLHWATRIVSRSNFQVVGRYLVMLQQIGWTAGLGGGERTVNSFS